MCAARCAANSAAWLVRRASVRSRANVRRVRKRHVRKLASALSLLVQSLLVHAKVPPCMLLSKNTLRSSMKKCMEKHTCVYGAGE